MNSMPASQIYLPYSDTTPVYGPADTLKSLAEILGYQPVTDNSVQGTDSIPYLGSFFKAHQLKVIHGMQQIPMPSATNPSYLLMLASLLILALLKIQRGPGLLTYFKSPSLTVRRDKYFFSKPTDWLLSLNALIVYTGIIFLISSRSLLAYYPTLSSMRLTFFILMPSLLIYLQVKKSLVSFLGIVFKNLLFAQSLISEENKSLRISGLLLLPLLVVGGISRGDVAETALLISLILILAFYLRKIFVWTLLAFKNINYLGIYFFLYFCTVEILPLAVVAKLLINNW